MSGSRIEGAVADAADAGVDVETPGADAPESAEVERPSRRKFFLGAAAVAAATTLVPARKAQAQRIVRPRPGIMTRPGAPAAVDTDTLLRLVNRITLGATEDEVKLAKSMGF